MTRISLDLDEALNKRLKMYCLMHFREPYGKQQEVLREALVEFLERREIATASPTCEKKSKKELKPRISGQPALIARIDKLLAEGKTAAQIAEEIGYARTTVQAWISGKK